MGPGEGDGVGDRRRLPALAGAVRRREAGRCRRPRLGAAVGGGRRRSAGCARRRCAASFARSSPPACSSELEDGRFATNDAAAALRGDASGRLRDVVDQLRRGNVRRVWRAAAHRPHRRDRVRRRLRRSAVRVLRRAPSGGGERAARMLARTLPVAPSSRPASCRVRTHLVNVGGGMGTLLATVLRRRPEVRGVLLERPGMLGLAHQYLSEQGVADRCELVEGDFFASVPERSATSTCSRASCTTGTTSAARDPAELPRRNG